MKLSIILPSYFRSELLNFGLESLSFQLLTCDLEILVLNDGLPDETEQVCNKWIKEGLNVKYVFTGQRNLDEIKWRVPGAVLNIGIKLAQGEIILLSSPEILHLRDCNLEYLIYPLLKQPNLLTIPEGKDDDKAIYLNSLKDSKVITASYDKLTTKLNTKLPFCMGMMKKTFESIGGYDSDFFDGYCFDDNDFVDRLLKSGYKHYQTNAKIIHLFNSRKPQDRIGLKNRNEQWLKNKKLYEEKR